MTGLIVDLFAGGGGASLGVERALGRHIDLAVNHDPHAIEMHSANHPHTRHLCESVFDVDPVEACGGRPVDFLWASPDCTHHSRAKGGKPREKKIRALAWVVVRWAATVAPAIIALENVGEFQEWGPLDDGGYPIREQRGETFRAFVRELEALGYEVEWRVLSACDYGAPTTRKRLFLIARRDGRTVVWPEPTHGPGRAEPYRTAAECIDWSIPCPSIFERPRPLAEATQRRIAAGIRKYVLECGRPFLLHLTHGGRLHPIDEPVATVTAAHRGEQALVAPWLVNTRNGERAGQDPRIRGLDSPAWTVTAQGSNGALVAAFLAKHYGGPNGAQTPGSDLRDPMGTVTAQDHHGLVAAHLTKFYGTTTGSSAGEPLHTITGEAGGGHHGLVAAFLASYYGQGVGQDVRDPTRTVTARDRFGLVTVTIGGEQYAIVDIGMRMLQPRELARAQGFPDSYILTGTKTQQVARIGNSVCPPVAEAVARAQWTAPAPKRSPKPTQMPAFRGDQQAA